VALLVVAAWVLQACCCGVPPPKPGPPGSISGQIHYPPAGKPGALVVYALSAIPTIGDAAKYTSIHVAATESSYTLPVPPGEYYVIARLDSDPVSAGGFTSDTWCSPACTANSGNHAPEIVRVESKQDVVKIDVGDWGTDEVRRLIWSIDIHGSPLSSSPEVSPLAKSLPSRPLAGKAFTGPTAVATSAGMGLTVRLPVGWVPFNAPTDNGSGNDAYVTNEPVTSPLALDSQGIWLTVHEWIETGCPFPDWRFTTARATVPMQGASNHFFFEDPAPRDGSQPFTGYSVRGGDYVLGNCIEFTMTGASQAALESNLPAFAAVVQGARFTTFCTSCPTGLVLKSS
jgi:hypothetical protein